MNQTHNPTDPAALSPEALDRLLRALLDAELTFPEVAARLDLTIDDLSALLATPDIQKTLESLQKALEQRSRLLGITSETAALGALATVMDELTHAESRRKALQSERAAALESDNHALLPIIDNSLAALEARGKELAELSRSARATLTFTKTKKPDPLPQIPQNTLRLAGGSE